MPALKIEDFSGTVPVKGDRALPENFATDSRNTWLYSNELIGVRLPYPQQPVQNGTEKVFRVPKGSIGGDPVFPSVIPPPAYLGDSVWLEFNEADTDIVRGPLVNDKFKRYYFCAPRKGLRFNTYARMLAQQPAYRCGVPPPTVAPVVADGSGTNVAPKVTRAYVYTFENEFGEESQPSPPTLFENFGANAWNITITGIPAAQPPSLPPGGTPPPGTPPPDAQAQYPLYTKINLYRTITSEAGVATYFKVTTIPWQTPSWGPWADTVTDETLSGYLQLETLNYTLPPDYLQGIIAMPNGFLIGWVDSTVYMSEPYQLHAWPAEYAVSSEYPVVGLGVLGTTCLVCTQSFPATLSGVKPVIMSFTKATTHEPCMSRGSIVSTPSGVFYASQNGLVGVSPSGINNITNEFITRAEWMMNYAPQYIRACRYQNGYLALRCVPSSSARSAFFFDPTAIKVALTEFTDFDQCANVQNDSFSGETFVIRGASPRWVYRWDPPSDQWMPTLWKTKEFQIPNLRNFGCYAIYWDEQRYTNTLYGGSIMPPSERVHFRVWADRELVYDQTVPKNGEVVRLPSGFKADIWQFEIRARAPVYALHLASTIRELGGF